MNELILTDRDTKDPVYSGQVIDWGNWNAYLVDLVCRCARKAAEKKYNYFGIQYYGEIFKFWAIISIIINITIINSLL